MVPIAFFLILGLAGFSMIFKERTNFSKNRSLIKPNSLYIGVALILFGFVNIFIPFSGIYVAIRVVIFLAIIITAYFISEKTQESQTQYEKKGVKHPILIALAGIIVLYLILTLIGTLLQK